MMAFNRSEEEFAMRRCIEAWGRPRWPGARLVHELVVASERRIDMAFIQPDNIVGIEIKSSRDTLDRLGEQTRVFSTHLPCVIIALAPKWGHKYMPGASTICCDGETVLAPYFAHSANRAVTAQMLPLLWAGEARAIAARMLVSHDPRAPLYKLVPALARALTGDEIVREVCRELRARDAFPRADGHPASDPPILMRDVRAGDSAYSKWESAK